MQPTTDAAAPPAPKMTLKAPPKDDWIGIGLRNYPVLPAAALFGPGVVLPTLLVGARYGWLAAAAFPFPFVFAYSLVLGRCVLPFLAKRLAIPWVQVPVVMPYPRHRVRAAPRFAEAERIPEALVLEAAAPAIKDELRAHLARFGGTGTGGPAAAGAGNNGKNNVGAAPPQDAFSEQSVLLAKDSQWGIINLIDSRGQVLAGMDAAFPQTIAALRKAGATTTFFSRLGPHSTITAHTGFSDGFWRCHLGLVVPQGAPASAMHVEEALRGWQEGRVLAFNDALRHWAVNGAAAPRYVLIYDVPRADFRRSLWVVTLAARIIAGTEAIVGSLPPYIGPLARIVSTFVAPTAMLLAALQELAASLLLPAPKKQA